MMILYILFYHDSISLFHLLRFIKNGSYSKNLPYRFRIQKVSKGQLSYRYYSKLYLIIIYSTQNINPINYLKIYRTKVFIGLPDIQINALYRQNSRVKTFRIDSKKYNHYDDH